MDREKIIKEYEDYVNSYISLTTSHDYEFEMHKAVLALLKEQGEEIENIKQTAQSMMEGVCLLKEQEAVVRCKDCIHWDKGHTEECDNSDSVCFHNGWCKPDWFCADGERKEQYDAEVDEKYLGDL